MSSIKPWEISQKINAEIEKIAISRINRFYPSYIANVTDLPHGIVLSKLYELEQQEAITIKYEFICENCDRSLLTVDKHTIGSIDMNHNCKYCGHGNLFNPLDAIPIIELNDDFKQSFTKKKLPLKETTIV